MASIIDGSTYKGFWKLTSDDSTPNDFYLIPKFAPIIFDTTDATSGNVKAQIGGVDVAIATDTATIDENGNALNTSAKVATYLSNNR